MHSKMKLSASFSSYYRKIIYLEEYEENISMKPSFDSVMRWILEPLWDLASVLSGHVREWGHHVGLQGVQSVIMVAGDDPLPSATP